MVSRLTDITRILDTDDLGLKMQAYDDLGISVTYDPTRRVARIESRPKMCIRDRECAAVGLNQHSARNCYHDVPPLPLQVSIGPRRGGRP